DPLTTLIYSLSLHDALPICHPLLDDPLHPDQAHAELVLEQLAHRLHPAVAEVVDVVGDLAVPGGVVELDQLAQDGDEVALLQDRSEEHTSELQSQSNLVCRL